MNCATLRYGGILTSIWMWSLQHSAAIISTSFLSHNSLRIFPISAFISPYIACLLYFGANTIWYLHLQLLCDKLFTSFMTWPPVVLVVWSPNHFYFITGGLFFYYKIFYLPPVELGVFSCLFGANKKEPAMFITSQALTGPIAGYCVFSDIKNPLSKFLWTVDIWCTSRDSNPGPAD